ncbi:hypothetical protein C8240_11135 [Paracidovorax cattleyae]|nr:hypothetical protein C8240_11135 [Paracidovorax cattleyae]
MIGQGGISAEGSNVSYSTTTNNTTLDADVVNRAFGFGNGALDFANDSLAGALGFGEHAMRMASDANADALAFADSNATRNSQMAYNVVGDALGSSDAAMSRALTFGANALDAAVGSSENALSRALSFGNTAMDRAYGTLADSQNLVKDAYADAKGRGALTDKMIMGAIAAMAVVAFAAIKK